VYRFGPHACRPGRDADATAEDAALVGGKGAGLAAMSRAGLHVPPGFTISTEAYRAFFEASRSWPAGLEDEIRDGLAWLEKQSGRRFGQGHKPLLVSVRSGAAVSMPGMMDTILNCGLHPGLAGEVGDTPAFWRVYIRFIEAFSQTVAGLAAEDLRSDIQGGPRRPRRGHPRRRPEAGDHPDASDEPSRDLAMAMLDAYRQRTGKPFPTDPWDTLVQSIDAVFESWHSERATAYRREHGIPADAGTAVNVQMMFPSQVSGICFTRDPNNLASSRMIIEASYGLGEAVVSGDVSPDRFIVQRDDFNACKAVIGNKRGMIAALGDDREYDPGSACLDADHIAELCALAIRIEEFFGKPMDVEWGWADGTFALLQGRPIRGLDVLEDVQVGRQAEIERLRSMSSGEKRIWVAHNLGETLRAPTPLTWDVMRRFMSGNGGFGRLYRDLGYRPSHEVREHGFLELICGRIYADPDRVSQLFWEGSPMVYDPEQVIHDPGLLESAPTTFAAEKTGPDFLLRLPGMAWSMIRSARRVRRARTTVGEDFETRVLPAFLDRVSAERERDLSTLPTSAILDVLDSRREWVLDDFGKESLKPGFFGGLALEKLQSLLVQLTGESEGGRLARTLTMGLEGDSTVEQNLHLYRVATGTGELGRFLEQFGHRCPGEMELAQARWREEPERLEGLLAGLAGGHSPEETHEANVAKREEAEAQLPELLAQCGGSSLHEDVLHELRLAQALLPYRETGKHYLMMGYDLIRLAILELANRWELGRDVFFLRLDELPAYESDPESHAEQIALRRVRWQSAQRLHVPRVIRTDELGRLGLPPVTTGGAELEGDAVASGVATGRARIVLDPAEAADLGRDYILVCPSTDPGWSVLFVNAAGLVVERGGILSHGAIIARDYGIPAVVCPDATQALRDGQVICLDGNAGKITIVEDDSRA